jgi:hypothetical protein
VGEDEPEVNGAPAEVDELDTEGPATLNVLDKGEPAALEELVGSPARFDELDDEAPARLAELDVPGAGDGPDVAVVKACGTELCDEAVAAPTPDVVGLMAAAGVDAEDDDGNVDDEDGTKDAALDEDVPEVAPDDEAPAIADDVELATKLDDTATELGPSAFDELPAAAAPELELPTAAVVDGLARALPELENEPKPLLPEPELEAVFPEDVLGAGTPVLEVDALGRSVV